MGPSAQGERNGHCEGKEVCGLERRYIILGPILVQKSIECVSGAFYSQKLLKPAQKTY